MTGREKPFIPPTPWTFLVCFERPTGQGWGVAYNLGHWMFGFEAYRGVANICFGPVALMWSRV